jgi:hypothetical protein
MGPSFPVLRMPIGDFLLRRELHKTNPTSVREEGINNHKWAHPEPSAENNHHDFISEEPANGTDDLLATNTVDEANTAVVEAARKEEKERVAATIKHERVAAAINQFKFKSTQEFFNLFMQRGLLVATA